MDGLVERKRKEAMNREIMALSEIKIVDTSEATADFDRSIENNRTLISVRGQEIKVDPSSYVSPTKGSRAMG